MSQDNRDKANVTMTGQVVRKHVSPGSKSERDAIMLVTEDGEELLLRRRHGHPFHDDVLEGLVGSEITFKGSRLENLVLMDEWQAAKTGKKRK